MKYFFAVIVVISSFSVKGQPLDRKIDSLVSVKLKKYKIPGLSVAVVKHDMILYNKGFGVRSILTKQPVDQHTIFHTASLSKLFTAQAIMNLVYENVLSLDDRVVMVVPWFKMADTRYEAITIRHLLNHTSGMPDVINYHWGERQDDPDALKNYVLGLSSTKLRSAPGEAFAYSSMDYNVLGYIIEHVTHKSFSAFMRENVLRPFEMIDSDFDYHKTDTAQRCAPHTRNFIFKNVHTRKVYPYNPAHSPSSTLNASSYELALWMKSWLKLISTDEVSQNPESLTLQSMLKPSENFSFFGLGWFIGEMSDSKSYYHFGGDQGFRSYLILLPEHDLGLVLLANCDYDEDFRQEILHGIANIVIQIDNQTHEPHN